MDLQRASACLQTYSGRDKAIRTALYALRMIAGRMSSDEKLAAKLMAMASQLSSARLIGRRLGDLGMLLAVGRILSTDVEKIKDPISFKLDSLVTYLYTIYNPVEHIAWLCDLKLINGESARWWRLCLYIWVVALVVGIVRSLRSYMKVALQRAELDVNELSAEEIINKDKVLADQGRTEFLNLAQNACDLVNGVNQLPNKILWAGKLPAWKASMFGMFASIIGLYKVYGSVS